MYMWYLLSLSLSLSLSLNTHLIEFWRFLYPHASSCIKKINKIILAVLAAALFLTGCPDKSVNVKKYTVTFNSNEGTTVPNQSVWEGGTVTAPENPTLEGFVFLFWSLDTEAPPSAYNFQSPVSSDITLVANWQDESTVEYWQVTWQLNSGAWGAGYTPPAKVPKGGTLPEPNKPLRTGYALAGWYKEPELINRVYFPFDISDFTGNFTLYAKWQEAEYIPVTWQLNGGSWPTGYTPPSRVEKGGILSEPTNTPVKIGSIFAGWYRDASLRNKISFPYNVGGANTGITLYAKWDSAGTPANVPGANLGEKFQWLTNNAQTNGMYSISVTADEAIWRQYLFYAGKQNVTIYLNGGSSMKTIKSLQGLATFSIGSGVTLVLEKNITLLGSYNLIGSVVVVNTGGTLVMNEGAKIAGNTTYTYSSTAYGGGVYIDYNGAFIMNGGEISDNSALIENDSDGAYGGGVFVRGSFTMNGGKIIRNAAYQSKFSNIEINSQACGGGVYVGYSGTFTMNGGEISGNEAFGFFSSNGGGVYVTSGTFIMNGGEIKGNASYGFGYSYGGGVYFNGGKFYLVTGKIYGITEPDGMNIAINGGDALYRTTGIAECGRFQGSTWVPTGTLSTTSFTINVVNGNY